MISVVRSDIIEYITKAHAESAHNLATQNV